MRCDNVFVLRAHSNFVHFARVDDAFHHINVGGAVTLRKTTDATVVGCTRFGQVHSGGQQKVRCSLPSLGDRQELGVRAR